MAIQSLSALEKVSHVRASAPAEGLFADKEWLLSPEPFPLDEEMAEELEKLGYRLNLFNRACNLLYQLSVRGRQPRWVADYLDRGKPAALVEYAREKFQRDEMPGVIRPDVIPMDGGFTIAELDNVPGGIGLTAWLNQTYAALGSDIVGGPRGMLDGFRSVLPGGDILVSEEAGTYRPEMVWLANQLNAIGTEAKKWRVRDASETTDFQSNVYRFFELFDLDNVGGADALMEAVRSGAVRVTPPFKPYIEEKMWFALFWMRPLHAFWRRELGERHWLKLQEVIPYTWIVDPTPLPQHAVLPRLEINRWEELGDFSQKQRDLLLKVSGFSHLSWGSRGVALGHDMPQAAWKAAVEAALREFDAQPRILQQFRKGKLFEHPYLDPTTGEMTVMHGRVRLCPYYFIVNGKSELKGVLATICPADKKLLHGMKDAILVPCKYPG